MSPERKKFRLSSHCSIFTAAQLQRKIKWIHRKTLPLIPSAERGVSRRNCSMRVPLRSGAAPGSASGRSEPLGLHGGQKLGRDRVAGLRTDHRVNAASWAQCGLADALPCVCPVRNFGHREDGTAVEAATPLTGQNLVAVADRVPVRLRDVRHRLLLLPNRYSFAQNSSVNIAPCANYLLLQRVAEMGHNVFCNHLRWKMACQEKREKEGPINGDCIPTL